MVAYALCSGGKVLIQQRLKGEPGVGTWEFPGGMVEASETSFEAICREVQEELGLTVGNADPVSLIDYPIVLLFFVCKHRAGEPRGKEGQTAEWVVPSEFEALALPLNEFVMGL